MLSILNLKKSIHIYTTQRQQLLLLLISLSIKYYVQLQYPSSFIQVKTN
jgi:hypothetical protein